MYGLRPRLLALSVTLPLDRAADKGQVKGSGRTYAFLSHLSVNGPPAATRPNQPRLPLVRPLISRS
eukprot:3584821-Lingulodinium_polyedra.AAC.1